MNDQVQAWFRALPARQQEPVAQAMNVLRERGTEASKDYVKRIKSSRYPNMYELRPWGLNLRVLFAYERELRTATMLVGGDKTGNWKGWYDANVRVADNLYDAGRRSSGKEVTTCRTAPGTRSVAGSR
jgi:hypothetical protein